MAALCSDQIMRARKVITRSGRKIRGKFPSRKLGKQVHWESPLERDAIVMFEVHPLVLMFQEQPIEEIYYDSEGQPHKCYPDFLLKTVGGQELLVEVKRSADLIRPSVRSKLERIALHFEQKGMPYRVITETEIHRQPLRANVERLWDALRSVQINDAARAIVQGLRADRLYRSSELVAQLGSEGVLLALIGSGALRTNLEADWTPESIVWRSKNKEAGDGSFSI
jgi:hypothetical protein